MKSARKPSDASDRKRSEWLEKGRKARCVSAAALLDLTPSAQYSADAGSPRSTRPASRELRHRPVARRCPRDRGPTASSDCRKAARESRRASQSTSTMITDDRPRQQRAAEAVQNTGVEKRPTHKAVRAADQLGDFDLRPPIQDFEPDRVSRPPPARRGRAMRPQ